jgi:hypothetical protein
MNQRLSDHRKSIGKIVCLKLIREIIIILSLKNITVSFFPNKEQYYIILKKVWDKHEPIHPFTLPLGSVLYSSLLISCSSAARCTVRAWSRRSCSGCARRVKPAGVDSSTLPARRHQRRWSPCGADSGAWWTRALLWLAAVGEDATTWGQQGQTCAPVARRLRRRCNRMWLAGRTRALP